MDWIAATLASTFLFALVSVMDRRLLLVHVPSGHAFNVLVAGLQLCISATVFLAAPWRSDPSTSVFLSIAASGAAQGLTLLCMFYALRFFEVSRFMPAYQVFPVVVAIMAIFLLDEGLSLLQWLAILVTVGGAILITFDPNAPAARRVAWPAYLLVLGAILTTAIANVSFKFAVDDMDFWNAMAVRTLFTGAVLLFPLLRPATLGEVRRTVARPKDFAFLVMNEGVLVPGALVLMLLGLKLGPVALVSTLMATRALFVLFISGALSLGAFRILDERFSRDTLPVKLLSCFLIVGGISILGLT